MARKAAKRRFTVFSLSFLDVMSCGFGAVVLIFLVINHRIDDATKAVDRELLSESRKLDYLIVAAQENLADLQRQVLASRKRVADARQQLLAVAEDRDRRRDETDELEARTIARRESIEELKSDVESRELDVERLQAEEQEADGAKIRDIKGEGDRQYLTGLFVGGTHVLIALDASASMLDQSIVQIVRRRNMSRERQLSAAKWQRAQRTVEWLAAQIPLDSHFQIALYNAQARLLLTPPKWHRITDPKALGGALEELAEVVPTGGTNLAGLADAIAPLSPPPDNIFLITDGLPTRATTPPRGATVNGRQRRRLFNDAVKALPRQVPINTILFPLEGDPGASAAYWELARRTGGTYISPSEDWP